MFSPFRVLSPTTLVEASGELERLGDQAVVYAGGAELLLLMRHGLLQPDYLVDVKPLPGFGEIIWDGEALEVGATVTHRRLERDPLVQDHLPVLREAETHVGNIRVRAQGTIGGNLCFADPHADPGTALLVHDTRVTIASHRGERHLELADFLVGTYETALEPGELLTGLRVAPLPDGWGGAFLRIERFSRPTVNVAAGVAGHNGELGEVRLAVGCVGPKAMRLPEMEAQLRGLSPRDATRVIAESKPYLTERLEPIGDLLGSAEYKIVITSVLLARALEQAVSEQVKGEAGT